MGDRLNKDYLLSLGEIDPELKAVLDPPTSLCPTLDVLTVSI